jgi:hypothetical protein
MATTLKDAVDAVVGHMKAMEAVFANQSFTDIEIPRKIIADILAPDIIHIAIRTMDWRRRDEDEHYEYEISARVGDDLVAVAYAYMEPPPVYDPYESHGEDDEDEDRVTFEWSGRSVRVDRGDYVLRFEGRSISVCFRNLVDRDDEAALIAFLRSVKEEFHCPAMTLSNSRRDVAATSSRRIVRKVNASVSL